MSIHFGCNLQEIIIENAGVKIDRSGGVGVKDCSFDKFLDTLTMTG